MGIEPTRSAWKAEVLPLNYIRNFLNMPIISFSDESVKNFFAFACNGMSEIFECAPPPLFNPQTSLSHGFLRH